MSKITAILEPAADGTLHLPVPAAWRHLAIRVHAELKPAGPVRGKVGLSQDLSESLAAPQPGCLKGFMMAADFDEPLEDFKEYMG